MDQFITESLPQESTVKQLQRIRRLSKGIDIGDRISDMNKQGANVQYIRNPIDSGIESYQDFEKSNKNFEPYNVVSRSKPFHGGFSGYGVPQDAPIKKKSKKKRSTKSK